MVVTFPTDPDVIAQLCKQHFDLKPSVIEIEDGVVNVPKASVIRLGPMRQLPVRFGYVHGMFEIGGTGLKTLEGCPHTVGGGFYCRMTDIVGLAGGPREVAGNYWVQENPGLVSLDGAPESCGNLQLTYNPLLRVLPLLRYDDFYIQKAPDQLKEIMFKYKGQGNKGVLKCAAELIKAGFRDNARL